MSLDIVKVCLPDDTAAVRVKAYTNWLQMGDIQLVTDNLDLDCTHHRDRCNDHIFSYNNLRDAFADKEVGDRSDVNRQ